LKNKEQHDIYEDKFVENLFNRMSKTYGITNYLSSFGFTERWRKQCVDEIDWRKDMNIGYDLMSGMGESWNIILNKSKVKIIGVDISSEMNKKAREKLERNENWDIKIRQENILHNDIKSETADFVVSTFGIKTFSKAKQQILAKEIYRILRKGGQISMVEISEPQGKILNLLFMFYLKVMIPIIGLLFMGNSLDYKMLGIYCQNFKDCRQFCDYLKKEGMTVVTQKYFFGCATGVIGYK
jgi:ubiquinone/menaquinone biosynthesis methyltransferase